MMRKWIGLCVLLLALAASPAHATWREASSKHFVIYSEQSEKSLKEFAERLERFDKGLRGLFGLPDPDISKSARVTIFVTSDLTDLRQLHGAVNSNVGGFYRNWPSGPVAFVPRSTGTDATMLGFNSFLVLQHEYAHHFMFRQFGGVFPGWFVEGFAEFASTAVPQRDGSFRFGLPADHRGYALLLESPVAVEKLFDVKYGDPADMDRVYARSWLLFHYLIVDPARRNQLGDYIGRINKRENGMTAARAAFGDLRALDRTLNSYRRFSYFDIAAEKLAIGPVAVRELGQGESAMMNIRMESKAGVNPTEAVQIVARARRIAEPYSTDAAAMLALTEAEFDANNYAEAEAAATKVLAMNPNDIQALVFRGRARMRQAVGRRERDPEVWREIRRSFTAANRLDPDDPEPLAYFFLSFLQQGIAPTPNSYIGALRSLALAPQFGELRMNAIQYAIRNGKLADGNQLLLWIASNPHGGRMQKLAADMMDALARNDTEAALALLGNVMREGREPAQAPSQGMVALLVQSPSKDNCPSPPSRSSKATFRSRPPA